MAIQFFAGAVIMLTALSGFSQNREIPLLTLIEVLRERGYTIIYSDSVVNTQAEVQPETFTIEALEKILLTQGLLLQRHGPTWVISPAPRDTDLDVTNEDTHQQERLLETVIVTGSRHHIPRPDLTASSHSFSPEDMTRVPAMASDAMRIALRLPGVSSVGVSAKPRIRGGLQDELLVIQDGVELLEPFHLADYHSAYSSIDYRTIESIDIYTGGFPSRYGNRMSGVMDISNNWDEGEYNTDIGVSSFANFIHTKGQIGKQMPTDWSLSLRQGDLSDLTDYIQSQSGKPEYLDVAARANIALSTNVNLALGIVHAEDEISLVDEEESASSNIDTDYLWAGLEWQLSESMRSRMTVSWLEFRRRKLLTSFEIEDEEEEKGGVLDHRQDVKRLALRNDFSALYGPQFIEFGWQAEYNSGKYRHRSKIDRGELAEIIGTEREIERDIYETPKGWSGGVYAQSEWQITEKFLIQPSLRWDYQDYYIESEYQLSPRLGLAYELDDDTRLRLSVGRFHQPESIQELQVIDGITRFYPPQNSDQVVGGLEWSRGRFAFVGEAYYKRYGKQKGRFENMFNPFVLLPEMEPDRVELLPSKALATGLDLNLKYEFSPRLSGSFRYSYMDAQDKINGEWITRRWSQRHTINAGLFWKKNSYSLSMAVTWHSGWHSSKLPNFVPEDTVIPIELSLNNVELDDYYSLDISARKFWIIGKARLQIYADIANVTDRRNAAGIDYDVEEVDGGYSLTPDHENLLRRVPSFGITLSF